MMNRSPVVISAAVEGGIDEAVVRSLIRHVGALRGSVYVKNGRENLLKSVKNDNQAAYRRPCGESGRQVGPAYSSRLIEFVENCRNGWRPHEAARSSTGLSRCLQCLRRLAEV
ncbi:MAG: hypothetical protein GX443_16770 [Deltaproteobacteria bacterium]|nr:hypothetical protein [Deltaproteobacteria bacterium]